MKIAKLCLTFGAWALVGCAASKPPIRGPQFHDDGCRDWVHDASGGVSWELNDNEDGIKTFTGEVEGSDFFAFRGAGIIDAPIAKVANVFIDTDRHKEWVPNFGGMRVLRDLSAEEKVIYRHVLTPAVIDDRDFVVRVRFHQDDKTGHLLIDMQSTFDKDAPPKDGIVRGTIHKNSGYRMWPVDSGKRTMVVFTIHVDPRGDVPSWIVNSFQDGYPLDNHKNIRKQAARADVVEHPKVREVFANFVPKCGAEKAAIPPSAAHPDRPAEPPAPAPVPPAAKPPTTKTDPAADPAQPTADPQG